MNYSALIQNRKSIREFSNKKISPATLAELDLYYKNACKRLIPELKTELLVFGEEAKEALEGAAGYHDFLIGAPQYLVLLSEKHKLSGFNAGYIMEDLILKLTDLDLGSCWLTFTDSNRIKEALSITSDLEVAAIAAFGYGVKTAKRIRLNIFSMSNVDIAAKRQYFEPKASIHDLVFLNSFGNREGVDDYIGFFDDMLWEAFYAAAQSPSYLNRQAYGFVIHDGRITLAEKPDQYNTPIDSELSLGIVLLHFTSVASQWAGNIQWTFDSGNTTLLLPEGYTAIASCTL